MIKALSSLLVRIMSSPLEKVVHIFVFDASSLKSIEYLIHLLLCNLASQPTYLYDFPQDLPSRCVEVESLLLSEYDALIDLHPFDTSSNLLHDLRVE